MVYAARVSAELISDARRNVIGEKRLIGPKKGLSQEANQSYSAFRQLDRESLNYFITRSARPDVVVPE
jgi:hypothetical protein